MSRFKKEDKEAEVSPWRRRYTRPLKLTIFLLIKMSPAVTHQTVYAARLNFITTPSRQETRNGTSPYVTRLPVTRTNAQLNFQLSKALPVTHQGMRRPLLVERENTYVDKYNRFVFFIIPFTIVTIATIVNPHVYEMKYLLFKNISG